VVVLVLVLAAGLALLPTTTALLPSTSRFTALWPVAESHGRYSGLVEKGSPPF